MLTCNYGSGVGIHTQNLYGFPLAGFPASVCSVNPANQPIGEVVAEFLLYKEQKNRRPEYLRTLKHYLNAFATTRGGTKLSDVNTEAIETWVRQKHKTPSGQCASIGRLSSFFTFCERRRYIESNPMRLVERPTVERSAPSILSPAQARDLLVTVAEYRPELLAYITVGLFCGVRPSEAKLLDWSGIDLTPRKFKELDGYGLLTIDASTSKVRRRRIMPIHPTAVAWLKHCPREEGACRKEPLVTHARTDWMTRRLAIQAGFKWSPDVLRHTAASYLLAQFEDAGRVSLWLGNSPQVLMTSYYQLVTPEDCAAFWSISA